MLDKKKTIPSKTKVLQLFHQDGIIDMVSGAVLINFGFDILNKNKTTSLFTWIPIILLSSLKNKTTIPRLGYKALGGDKKQIDRWIFYTAGGMVLSLILFGIIILDDPLKLQDTLTLPFDGNSLNLLGGVILAAACFITGLLISLKRFYVYALAALSAGIISYFFLPVHFPFFFTAGIMSGYGVHLMINFTRAHPLDDKEKSNE
ncbi:MAG: hypothetical protein J7K66_05980 [Anaerolineaceae bacterium]|nr:hypothetical protein [Anaerolineaceae bacterium]